jgi:hypothetical protein
METSRRQPILVYLLLCLIAALIIGCFSLRSYRRTAALRPFRPQMPHYSSVCAGVLRTPAFSGRPQLRVAPVRQKFIVINMDGDVDPIFWRLPREIRAGTPQEVGTVVAIEWSEVPAATYQSGATGYRRRARIWLVDDATGRLVAHQICYGPEPPQTKSGTSDWHGPQPTRQIVDYLRACPESAPEPYHPRGLPSPHETTY